MISKPETLQERIDLLTGVFKPVEYSNVRKLFKDFGEMEMGFDMIPPNFYMRKSLCEGMRKNMKTEHRECVYKHKTVGCQYRENDFS